MHLKNLLLTVPCAGAAFAALAPLGSEQQQQHVIAPGRDAHDDANYDDVFSSQFKCDLPPKVVPAGDGFPDARDIFGGKAALLKQVERHSAIVRVPSISYDDLGPVDEDERWEVFFDFHKVLEEQFPNIHARMTREKINRFGLVYTINGSDPSLKPLMLTAHQDVVPVADPTTWTHPPFEAYFDGTWLWGRGASDDKNSLTALMSALETLFASRAAWAPRRTIVLAFGFDEECSGQRGAGTIGPHLEARYGRDGVALILDEGGMGLQQLAGGSGGDALYALPAVMEKGHVDIWLELHVQGGHSSIPFPHTGIGIVGEVVAALEAHPYAPRLDAGTPVHNHLVCQARYSPDADPELTRLVRRGDLHALARELATVDRPTQFRIQTSQSVDFIAGGQKINAMPEVVRLGVNYRVAPQDSIAKIKRNVVRYTRPIAKKYKLTVKAFEGEADPEEEGAATEYEDDYGYDYEDDYGVEPLYEVDYNGTLVLSSSQRTQVAPVSPSSGPVWDLFSGTIQHSFAFDGGKVIPVGELMTGNTDTRHYLGLTRHVYRWTPTRQGGNANTHTIDERIDMNAHMEALRFYYDLIRNFDASEV